MCFVLGSLRAVTAQKTLNNQSICSKTILKLLYPASVFSTEREDSGICQFRRGGSRRTGRMERVASCKIQTKSSLLIFE